MNAPLWTTRRRKYVARALGFLLGLVVLVALCERAAGWYTTRTDGRHLIGREVYLVQNRLKAADPAVRRVYLGDSVARQLFPPGEESSPSHKYLTSNQAISMAGQFYLLEQATSAYPNLREVTLFYTANGWANDLDQVYTHDYFCGYFHQAEQIADVFAVKRDLELLSVHVARALLPQLMAMNSALSVVRTKPADEEADTLTAVERPQRRIEPSRISDVFLQRMRRLCARRGLVLRVYPCPAPDAFEIEDPYRVYDAPVVQVPARHFRTDGVHLKKASVPDVRRRVEEALHLGSPEAVEGGSQWAARFDAGPAP
jgi:hypothetical protein